MIRRRLPDLGLLLLAALVIALAVVALRPPDRPDQVLSPPPTPTPTARAVQAVFLGEDSISTAGRADRASSAALAGGLLGWDTTVLAQDGTGFLSGGQDGSASYPARIAAELAGPPPDAVVVMAGTSDRLARPADLRAAVQQTIAALRARLPLTTRLVLVGPYGSDVPQEQARLQVVATVLREVTAAERVHYVDPIAEGWLGGQADALLAPDGLHLSPEGDAELGRRLAEALERFAVKPAT